MKYEYYFYRDAKPELVDYLNSEKIPCKLDLSYPNDPKVVFRLWSTGAGTERQLRELEKIGVRWPIISVTYTKRELENAELLKLRPRKQWVSVTNEEVSSRYTCPIGRDKFMHEEQIGPYCISKEPKSSGRTAFWCEDTGWADVFTDFRVKKLAEDHGLVGVEFLDVLLRENRVSQNIFQLRSSARIPRDAICLGYGEQPISCPVCGREQYGTHDIYQLHLDFARFPAGNDLYMTESMWGYGFAYPMYVISQRFYRLLRENKLDGYLNLLPVIAVEGGTMA